MNPRTLLPLVLLLTLSACAGTQPSLSGEAVPSVPGPAASDPSQGPELSLPEPPEGTVPAQTYREALLERAPFLCSDDMDLYYVEGEHTLQYIVLADVPALFDPDSGCAALDSFTVADLDQDGSKEVVLHTTSVAGDMSGYLILRQTAGGIWAFPSYWRTFWDLKTDGTFYYDDWAGTEAGYASVHFTETGCRLNKFLYAQGEQLVYDTFFSNGQAVSKEEYDTAQAKQEEKPLAQWLAFTPENLEAAFPAPAS